MLSYYPHLIPKHPGIVANVCLMLKFGLDIGCCMVLLPFQETQKKPGEFRVTIRHSIKIPSQWPLFVALPGNHVRCLKASPPEASYKTNQAWNFTPMHSKSLLA